MLRTKDEFEQWMSDTPEEAYSLVRTPDPEIMHIVQSGIHAGWCDDNRCIADHVVAGVHMSIDRKRVAAVAFLEANGYRFEAGRWIAPDALDLEAADGDSILAMFMCRADHLAGCVEDSPEAKELRAITEAIEAYEQVRWPAGKTADGKG